MWKISKSNKLYRVGHIHRNIEVYLFNLDKECPLCKELIPDSIKVQKDLLNSGAEDEFQNYYSDGFLYLRPHRYSYWSKYNKEKKQFYSDLADDLKKIMIKLLSEYGYHICLK